MTPKAAKTRIVELRLGGEGLDFLGFHHRLARSKQRKGRKPVPFLARWPADKAMRHARERIRELTRLTSKWPFSVIMEDLNLFLRGWAAYFRFGHSYRQFAKIRFYAAERLALLIARRLRCGGSAALFTAKPLTTATNEVDASWNLGDAVGGDMVILTITRSTRTPSGSPSGRLAPSRLRSSNRSG